MSMSCYCRSLTDSSPALLFLNIVFHFLYFVKAEILCEQVNGSRCKFCCNSGKDIIDLSTLDNSSDQPRFTDIRDFGNSAITYAWNPCTKFSMTLGCVSVNVCQMEDGRKSNNLGDDGPILAFDTIKSQYFMSYLGPEKFAIGERKTNVYLKYDGGSSGRTSRMRSTGDYFTLTLYTKYAPHSGKVPGSDSGSSKGLSIGTVLLIIFFCVLFLYLIIGMTFMKYQRGAQGKNIIPHYSFWSEIPGFAKDGCVYSVNMIKRCGSSANRSRDYEEI